MSSSPTPARRLAPLYQGTFLFGVACGISLALTPLVLSAGGIDKEAMGTLALFFASGLVLASLPAGRLLKRLGARAVLTTALLGYAACVGLFPFAQSYAAIAGIRFVDGACSILIWVASETLVLARSNSRHKAHLTSLYAIWLASGYVTGPFIARVLAPWTSHRSLFLVAAALAVVAAFFLHRRLQNAGAETDADDRSGSDPEFPVPLPGATSATVSKDLPLGGLLHRIKVSCAASFSYGYFQAAVVLFLPLYLMESKGIAEQDTIILPGLFCLGMLLCSNWAGRRADAWGHLLMMVALSTVGMGCIFGFVFVDHYWLMCGLVFAAGATLAAMSPIALALTGIVSPPGQLERANALYNTFYASGILLGPPLSSLVFARFGGVMMLLQLALLWAGFILLALMFAQDDPSWRRGRAQPVPVAED